MNSFSPSPAPLNAAQLAEHFSAVQSYIRLCVETRTAINVVLRSPVPGSRTTDGWRLRLGCMPEVIGPRVEWVAAYAIDALVDVVGEDDEDEPTWDLGREVISSAVELTQVTAAFAAWLLREGWLGIGSELVACEATDCMLSFIGGELLAEQCACGTAIPMLPRPHWVRAIDRRKAFEARGEARVSSFAPPPASSARDRESGESALGGS